jgi:MazG family protein
MNSKSRAFERLQEVVEVLRGPEGCPWDRAQKLPDMSRYLLEEACEAVDAIADSRGKATRAVKEELGDVLMNILLAARIAEEGGDFDIAGVADGIREKLIRRHPHVFADAAGTRKEVSGVGEVLVNWNAIKEEEKKEAIPSAELPGSRLDGVPRSLPALERSFEIGKRAAQAGFDWPDARGALAKVSEEVAEIEELLGASAQAAGETGAGSTLRSRLEEEMGDLLFAVVSLSRKLDIRPEAALRRTLRKFCGRFRRIEERFPHLEKASLEEMEAVWQESKSLNGEEEPHAG